VSLFWTILFLTILFLLVPGGRAGRAGVSAPATGAIASLLLDFHQKRAVQRSHMLSVSRSAD
jgi:predicted secreted protein